MSSQITPMYLQQEELLSEECKELISTLPREKGWISPDFYRYQGFWYPVRYLQGMILCRKNFQVKDRDVFLVTTPKSGTTWLKAIMFTLLNRKKYLVNESHPLLTCNPHDLVPFLETKLYTDNETANMSSARLFATHIPYACLPESVKKSPTCKLVYLCRNPKDTFVSLCHFSNKLRLEEMGKFSIGELFESFCNGVSSFGPFWDHVLEYWKQSRENPDRVLFLKYEDMKEQPGLCLRRLAKFSGCSITAEEEESGMVEQILKLCSFDNLRGLEVNKKGKLSSGVENHSFFRKGEVGDWKNYLSAEMAGKIDQITREKFFGSGLELL